MDGDLGKHLLQEEVEINDAAKGRHDVGIGPLVFQRLGELPPLGLQPADELPLLRDVDKYLYDPGDPSPGVPKRGGQEAAWDDLAFRRGALRLAVDLPAPLLDQPEGTVFRAAVGPAKELVAPHPPRVFRVHATQPAHGPVLAHHPEARVYHPDRRRRAVVDLVEFTQEPLYLAEILGQADDLHRPSGGIPQGRDRGAHRDGLALSRQEGHLDVLDGGPFAKEPVNELLEDLLPVPYHEAGGLPREFFLAVTKQGEDGPVRPPYGSVRADHKEEIRYVFYDAGQVNKGVSKLGPRGPELPYHLVQGLAEFLELVPGPRHARLLELPLAHRPGDPHELAYGPGKVPREEKPQDRPQEQDACDHHGDLPEGVAHLVRHGCLQKAQVEDAQAASLDGAGDVEDRPVCALELPCRIGFPRRDAERQEASPRQFRGDRPLEGVREHLSPWRDHHEVVQVRFPCLVPDQQAAGVGLVPGGQRWDDLVADVLGQRDPSPLDLDGQPAVEAGVDEGQYARTHEQQAAQNARKYLYLNAYLHASPRSSCRFWPSHPPDSTGVRTPSTPTRPRPAPGTHRDSVTSAG